MGCERWKLPRRQNMLHYCTWPARPLLEPLGITNKYTTTADRHMRTIYSTASQLSTRLHGFCSLSIMQCSRNLSTPASPASHRSNGARLSVSQQHTHHHCSRQSLFQGIRIYGVHDMCPRARCSSAGPQSSGSLRNRSTAPKKRTGRCREGHRLPSQIHENPPYSVKILHQTNGIAEIKKSA